MALTCPMNARLESLLWQKSMTKLNIFQVNGIWQLGRPQHANEEEDEEDELPPQDDEGGQPEEENPTQRELLNQILSGIQNMNTRMDRMEVTLADIRRHQGY